MAGYELEAPIAGADHPAVATDQPPRIPFVLSIGVTGHRLEALARESLPRIERHLEQAFALLVEQTRLIAAENAPYFSPGAPELHFVSPLADGADQMAAIIALRYGFSLQAILPFPRDVYLETLLDEASRKQLEALLVQSRCVLELPGERTRSFEAYVMAGRATIAHSDLLIAVWDGLPPRGRGGTGEVVELAVSRGTPVIHVPASGDSEMTIRWSAFDPAVVTRKCEPSAERPFDPAQVHKVMEAVIAPPQTPQEREFIRSFHAERRRRFRYRLEYPLLLAAAGVARLKSADWDNERWSEYTNAEWESFEQSRCRTEGVSAEFERLRCWYDWLDRLGGQFAQAYRSGHVVNFVLGAFAVLLVLFALIVPDAKKYLATAEFIVIVGILINTRIGNRHQWHRRWLDYRQLAERIRPMRSLKLLGLAAPDHPGTATNPVARRWIDWFAARAWRAIGCPSGVVGAVSTRRLGHAMATHELMPQIAYHRTSARQMHKLDHRLEKLGTMMFAVTLVGCGALISVVWVNPEWVHANIGWFALITAGPPAVGTAILGIRMHSDLGARAARSENTAALLETIAVELEQCELSLMRTADLGEEAARAMYSDLEDWRLISQQHELELA
jgi:hypothetical protein